MLLLEDDEDNLLVLETALELSGHTVQTARCCADAEAVLAAGDVDALVSDYSLADCNAIDWLKALGDRRPRVALLVTGYGDAETRAASRAAGFDAHLVKPVVPSELDRCIRSALGG